MSSKRRRLIPLSSRLRQLDPRIDEPNEVIAAGLVEVDGRVVTNPRTMVHRDSTVRLRDRKTLRGEAKLTAAIDRFGVILDDRVALDVGAAAGGFTRTLIRHGARLVFAVDVGHGQLIGSLRQDGRVVVLERTNLAQLSTTLVPNELDVVTLDLSYLSVSHAGPQLNGLALANAADLLALVKPMFELGFPELPALDEQLDKALDQAMTAIELAGWSVVSTMKSPVTGSRGAVEFFVHARRLA
jgi:23S rRNA (cytidine1920-2'-O)/16S rRNA (cytidine1409-2'-O)-methyltransferase